MRKKYTLVRMIESKEPVLFATEMETLSELGYKIDECTSPYDCEYLDVEIKTDNCLLWLRKRQEEQSFGDYICDGLTPSESFFETLRKAFKSRKKWTKFPENYDFYSLDKDEASRLKDFAEVPF